MDRDSGFNLSVVKAIIGVALIGVVIWGLAQALPRPGASNTPGSDQTIPAQSGVGSPNAGSGSLATAVPDLEFGIKPESVRTYTVKAGDNLFDIAERFGLSVETILSANPSRILSSETFSPQPEVELIIPPEDGVYHLWNTGDELEKVAQRYGVTVGVILSWPDNRLDELSFARNPDQAIKPGILLFIPGGHLEISTMPTWFSVGISRENPASGENLGLGYCPTRVGGSVGTGNFLWPVGFDQQFSFDSTGKGIYIQGPEQSPVRAADDGVVLFSGWTNAMYRQAVIIDHGNGWQTFYGNLATISVVYAESVRQGNEIGTIGATDDTSGVFLQFEMFFEGLVDPLKYLPALP